VLQVTPWSIPSLAALLLATAMLLRIRRSRGMPGAFALSALCVCSMIWALGQLLGSLTTDLALKILASKLQYAGIALLPATWLMFAINYLRSQRRMAPGSLAMLLALPLTTIVLAWTNDLHGLLWTHVELQPTDGYVGAAYQHGAWFKVHLVASYAMVIAATVILRFELQGSPRYARARAAVLLAPLAVLLVNAVYLSPWNPLTFIDPSPLGLAIAIWILDRGVLQSGLLDISPQLHRQVVEELRDPIIVVDPGGRILEANPAARSKLRGGEPLIGLSINTVLPDGPIAELCHGLTDSAEIQLGERTWHVRATLLDAGQRRTRNTVLALRNITERLAAEQELRRVKQEMERLAHTDSLTGLANRRFFMQRLHEEIERARRHGHPLSVLLLDLDLFKQVNDTHGHDAGDRILVAVAATIQAVKRASDVVARFGGEEFALLLPETDGAGAARLAERLRHGIATTRVDAAGQPVSVTTSIGSATIRTRESDLDDLLVRADRALYRAKHGGRDRVFAAQD
jgi:diguanylate cyclase (GGDEF)-like protein